MQFAHPLIAAGVGDHSSFKSGRIDRFKRLHGTVRAMLSLTFGDEDIAFRTAQDINKIHDRVNGVLKFDAGRFPAGTPYSAHDPVLLHWVLMTLLDSIPLAYTRMIGPLSPDEEDRYCQESARLGRWLGIPEDMLPQSMDAVRTEVRRVMASGDLVVTNTARELLRRRALSAVPTGVLAGRADDPHGDHRPSRSAIARAVRPDLDGPRRTRVRTMGIAPSRLALDRAGLDPLLARRAAAVKSRRDEMEQ